MKLPLGHVGKIIGLLDRKQRLRLLLLGMGAILVAAINVVGVSSIMPFMAVASEPKTIHTNLYLSWTYNSLGFRSDSNFLILLGVAVLMFLVLSNVTQAYFQYFKTRFTSMSRHMLSLRLMKTYLGQDYAFFLNRNSYEFIKNIIIEVNQLINGTLMQFVDLASQLIQVLLLTAFLFVVNPASTLVIAIVVGSFYGSIFYGARKTIRRLGRERFDLTQEIARIVSEAFWGIKEVKITGVESVFAQEYSPPSKKLAKNASTSELIGDIPKFALEAIAFATIMVFVLITIVREGSFTNAVATVTLFAYAGYRLIPAVQSLFRAFTWLKYSAPTADRMMKEFVLSASAEALPTKTPERLPFERLFELRSIRFTYPNVDRPLINRLSLEIQANSLVGFAGKTGSGKTTLVDIILGLLKPESGAIVVDGRIVEPEAVRAWQANLGYVPQNIYLSDDTVSANIAFGVARDKIDQEAVERAAQMAQIHDFIADELKQGYSTPIGERGVRLSGGQRQRIGIARALYRNPSMLIMDEATSSLDNQTERAVMEAIDRLMGTKTIILIAHRLSTLRNCDTIFLIERGEIVDQGSYAELEERNRTYFRQQ
jgi:ATP-binding cassette, subfamily B, bacterial PglK